MTKEKECSKKKPRLFVYDGDGPPWLLVADLDEDRGEIMKSIWSYFDLALDDLRSDKDESSITFKRHDMTDEEVSRLPDDW